MILVRRLSAALIAWATAAAFAHADSGSTLSAPERASEQTVLIGEEGYAVTLALLLRDGNYEAALALIESRPDLRARPDGLRLQAELLAILGRVDEALILLERRLSNAPTDALARFQLAEIQLAAGREVQARSAYRLAMAGDLDTVRQAVAAQRMVDIQKRRGWTASASVSIAPDSNLNAATNASTVDLFGIPFELSDDARRRSGLSAVGTAAGKWRGPSSRTTALAIDIFATVTDAPGGTFDQAQVSVGAGPEILLPALDVIASARLSVQRRWFGGEALDDRIGVRTFLEWTQSPSTVWRGGLQLDHVSSARSKVFDGQVYGGYIDRTRYVSPTVLWKITAGWTRDDLGAASQSSDTVYLSAGRLVPLPVAVVMYVEPYGFYRRFAGPAAAFGVAREDRELGLSVRLSKRDWLFYGASPFIQATVSRADSNIVLGRYNRERVEFGFTRDF